MPDVDLPTYVIPGNPRALPQQEGATQKGDRVGSVVADLCFMFGRVPQRWLWLALLLGWLAIVAVRVIGAAGEYALADLGWKLAYNGLIFAAAASCIVRAVRREEERREWALIGTAVGLWAVGNTYWTFFLAYLAEPPYPSVSDAFWLAFYPPVSLAIVMLARKRLRGFRLSFLLDGVVGALAVGAVVTAIVFASVADATSANFWGTVVNLSYPLADTVLLALAVGALIMMGGRTDRSLLLLAAGLLVFGASDSVYLYQVAAGTYAEGGLVDLGWPAAAVLFAIAAWAPRTRAGVARAHWVALLLPAGFAAVSLSVLVYDHFSRVTGLAIVLAAASVVAVTARTALTVRDYLRVIEQRTSDATTDGLTGMGNRRKLNEDLDALLSSEGGGVLGVFDLNGFKHYNDTFGHPAGDALLARLGARLSAATAGRGSAYRMGGDEFCVLLQPRGEETGTQLIARAATALAEEGGAFTVSASFGTVDIPVEASNGPDALRIADQRMYAQKHGARTSAYEQASSVLHNALRARDPELGDHLAGVAQLAERVAQLLSVVADERATIRMAAALHDIGKVGLPDAILHKAGPLDDAEWTFVRRHPLIGEKILSAAPALSGVAALVRASHERWDGNGYPDQVAGEQIPLGARIIFACDAVDAMMSDRPYSAAISQSEAVRELRRHAGTQFDPRVAEALCIALEEVDSTNLRHGSEIAA